MAELAVRRSLDTATSPDVRLAARSMKEVGRPISVIPTRDTSTGVMIVSHSDQDHVSFLFTSPPAIEIERRVGVLMKQLQAVYEDASTQGWDGYGASPVSPATYELAKRVAALLARTVPPPDVGADPDGEVSFEWYRGHRHVFTVSVGADGRLSYAGLFGASKVHGVEHLQGELPQAVLANLRRLLSSDS